MATPSSSSTSRSLATPVTSTSKLSKQSNARSDRRDRDRVRDDDSEEGGRTLMAMRPESEEMVVVTYEEGLAKLGLGRPHHILFPDDPPQFEETQQAYPTITPPSSTASSSARTVPGRSGLRREERQREMMESRRREEREDLREWARSPVRRAGGRTDDLASARESPGGSGRSETRNGGPSGGVSPASGRNEAAAALQSTWLPSYYHSPEHRGRDVEDSELGYAGPESGTGTASSGYTAAEREMQRIERWVNRV